MGTAVALPFLDAMVAGVCRGAAQQPPVRMAFVYVPNGIDHAQLEPGLRGQAAANCRAF